MGEETGERKQGRGNGGSQLMVGGLEGLHQSPSNAMSSVMLYCSRTSGDDISKHCVCVCVCVCVRVREREREVHIHVFSTSSDSKCARGRGWSTVVI